MSGACRMKISSLHTHRNIHAAISLYTVRLLCEDSVKLEQFIKVTQLSQPSMIKTSQDVAGSRVACNSDWSETTNGRATRTSGSSIEADVCYMANDVVRFTRACEWRIVR